MMQQASVAGVAGQPGAAGGVGGAVPGTVQGVGAAGVGGGAPQFASLYVGDLEESVSEAMLYEIFNTVGPVASIRVCRDSVTRRSLGYAYVNFHSAADAERVMDTLNYSTIRGRCCRIMWSHRDPNLRKTGNGNVFVKNLDKNVDNKALYDTFSLFGNILSCKVAVDLDGKSKGYGFVHYETAEAAKQAIEKVNNMQIGEKTVYVGEFLPRDGRQPAEIVNFTNIYVKNFPSEMSEEELIAKFAEFGTVTSSMLQKDKRGRPFAFINYEASDAAAAAIRELHRKDLRSEEEKAAAPHGRNMKGEPLDKPADEDKKEEKKEEEKKEDEEKKDENKPAEEGGDKKEGDEKKEGEENTPTDDLLNDEATHPDHLMFVSRAMTKSEREQMLKSKFKSSSSNQPAGVNLYIKNLPDSIDDEALRNMFSPYGEITSARVMLDGTAKNTANDSEPKPISGRSKGFGFVCFKTPAEATAAVSDMHLKTVAGKPLYVGLAEKKEDRTMRLAARYKGEGVAGGPGGMQAGAHMGGLGGNMQGQQGMPASQMGMNPSQMGQMGQMNPGMQGKGGMAGPGGMQMQGPMAAMGMKGAYDGGKGMQMGGPGGMKGYPAGYQMNPAQMNPQQLAMKGMNPASQMNPMMRPGMPQQMGQFPQQQMQNRMLMGQQAAGQYGMMGKGVPGPQGGQMPGNPGFKGGMQMPNPQFMGGKGQLPQQQMGGPQQMQQQQQRPMGQPQQMGQQPQQMGQQGQQQQGQQQQLTQQSLASAPPGMQKQMLGEKLYPAVSRLQPDLAGKITGMMLEMDNGEVLMMLDSEAQLRQKVDEAVRVLNQMK